MKHRTALVALAAGLALFTAACGSEDTPAASTSTPAPTATEAAGAATEAPGTGAVDARNATYLIEGKEVTLVDGVAEVEAAPGSASKITTRYFGNEATGDLNGDGHPDIAVILTQDGGGSGTFFYVAVALRSDTGYIGTNAVLLGDRVAPQPTAIRDGEVIANYADRAPGEPMTAPPSVGTSKYLVVRDGQLVQR